MASDFAMVFGFGTGRIRSVPALNAAEMGLHPVACAPWMTNDCSSISPTFIASWYAFAILVSSDPLAIGTTVCRGVRQPSCSMISNPCVFEPSA